MALDMTPIAVLSDYCPPGKYSAYGTVPCTPCAVGSYTDVKRATECTVCPLGMTTSNEGTASSEGCQRKTTYSLYNCILHFHCEIFGPNSGS